MQYLKQFLIILLISCLGELCEMGLPLPIPASVYGLVLMFVALCTHVIRLEQVEHVAKFLLEIMVVMFTPPAVGLIAKWPVLKNVWPQVLVIVILTTLIVMFVTGHVAQALIRLEKRRHGGEKADS